MSLPELSDTLVQVVGDAAHMQNDALGLSMTVSDITIETPIEIGFHHGAQVKVSPPTQRTETSILPVFHQMKVHFISSKFLKVEDVEA